MAAISFSKVNGLPTLTLGSGEVVSLVHPSLRLDKSSGQLVISENDKEKYFISVTNSITINGVAAPVDHVIMAQKIIDDVFNLKDFSTLRQLLASNVALSHTGNTTETTIYTGTIPANSIGVNGSFIANFITSTTNSAGTKLFRLKFNGTTIYSYTPTTSIAQRSQGQITNRNSLTSQIAGPNSVVGFGVAASSAIQTFAINTGADITVTVTVQLSSGTDTATLEALQIMGIG